MPLDTAFTETGTGTPLILIHGVGARRQVWDDLCGHLVDDFCCITYDLRGHGETPAPSSAFELTDLVEDLHDLQNRLGLERAHVAGHSLGAMIAAAHARCHPDRVLSAGLLSTAAFRTEEDRAKVRAVVARLESEGAAPVLDALVARWFTDAFMARAPEAVEKRKRQVLETDIAVFCNVFRIYAETEMAPWLHEVEAPSLVMTGSLDGGCNPRLNRQIAAALPHSGLVILEGLKHAILIEAPERVADAYRRFLGTLSRI